MYGRWNEGDRLTIVAGRGGSKKESEGRKMEREREGERKCEKGGRGGEWSLGFIIIIGVGLVSY